MRNLSTAILLTCGLALASPALAKSNQKFESTISAPVSAVNVEVVIGEDLAWRGENLPKDRRDRGRIRSLSDGFGGNGFYGDRDLNRLAERLEEKMEKRLMKEGVEVSDNAPQTLKIILTDARPNHPTFRQLSKSPSLSHRSVSLGGAAFTGELISNGESQGAVTYAWYESNIHDAQFGGTWSDAHMAIDRFAKKTAKTLD